MKYTHKVKLKDGSVVYRSVAPKDAKLAMTPAKVGFVKMDT